MIKVQTFPFILECHNPVNLTPALTLGLHCKKRWLEDSLHFSIARPGGPREGPNPTRAEKLIPLYE